jgi:hypothetical protein
MRIDSESGLRAVLGRGEMVCYCSCKGQVDEQAPKEARDMDAAPASRPRHVEQRQRSDDDEKTSPMSLAGWKKSVSCVAGRRWRCCRVLGRAAAASRVLLFTQGRRVCQHGAVARARCQDVGQGGRHYGSMQDGLSINICGVGKAAGTRMFLDDLLGGSDHGRAQPGQDKPRGWDRVHAAAKSPSWLVFVLEGCVGEHSGLLVRAQVLCWARRACVTPCTCVQNANVE